MFNVGGILVPLYLTVKDEVYASAGITIYFDENVKKPIYGWIYGFISGFRIIFIS